MAKELSETEIDKIYEDAQDAALHAWGPLGSPKCKQNPYPIGSRKADIWDHAFRNAYAKENGY